MKESFQKISFNCPEELADLLKKKADALKLDGGISEVIRLALEQYFQAPAVPKPQGNMQVVLYELAKTRELVCIGLEKLGAVITDADIDQTEKVAGAYVEKRS